MCTVLKGCYVIIEPPREKTQINLAVTEKLIRVFVFTTCIVQSLFFLNPKFQASSSLLWLYSPVCVGPVQKPHCWLSHKVAQLFILLFRHPCAVFKGKFRGASFALEEVDVLPELSYAI